MKSEKIKSTLQVFVCNYKREDDECCFDKGAKALTDKLKKWSKEDMDKEIKIYRSGCLGKCSEGIAIACFPQKKLLLDVTIDDVDELKEDLKEALHKCKD